MGCRVSEPAPVRDSCPRKERNKKPQKQVGMHAQPAFFSSVGTPSSGVAWNLLYVRVAAAPSFFSFVGTPSGGGAWSLLYVRIAAAPSFFSFVGTPSGGGAWNLLYVRIAAAPSFFWALSHAPCDQLARVCMCECECGVGVSHCVHARVLAPVCSQLVCTLTHV